MTFYEVIINRNNYEFVYYDFEHQTHEFTEFIVNAIFENINSIKDESFIRVSELCEIVYVGIKKEYKLSSDGIINISGIHISDIENNVNMEVSTNFKKNKHNDNFSYIDIIINKALIDSYEVEHCDNFCFCYIGEDD